MRRQRVVALAGRVASRRRVGERDLPLVRIRLPELLAVAEPVQVVLQPASRHAVEPLEELLQARVQGSLSDSMGFF